VNVKRFVRSGAWLLTLEGESMETPDYFRAAGNVSQRLVSFLEQQSLEAGRRGPDYMAFYREAQYVMAALADEVFLHLDWEGREAWSTQLIEYKLFRSRIAGDLFFDRLDKVLQNRDPVYRDVGAVYLQALMLGFRGKYWGIEDSSIIDNYRRHLFTFVYRSNPELTKESKRLFPAAYAHTSEEGGGRMLPKVAAWYALLGILIALYLAMSSHVWSVNTDELQKLNTEIEKLHK
jgi:type VI secretion system protein ImpK